MARKRPAPPPPPDAHPFPSSSGSDEEDTDENDVDLASPPPAFAPAPKNTSPPTQGQQHPTPPAAETFDEGEDDDDDGASSGCESECQYHAEESDSSAKNAPEKKTPKPPPPWANGRWSGEDEVRILEALAAHSRAHGGAVLSPAALLPSLAGSLDKEGCDRKDLSDKVHSLKRRYVAAAKRVSAGFGLPANAQDRLLYSLSKNVWGTADATAERTRRRFEELRELYPNLAGEAEALGGVARRAFECIGDDVARALEGKVKKQRVAEVKAAVRAGELRKELTNTLIQVTVEEDYHLDRSLG